MKRRPILDVDYASWSKERLIQRIVALEGRDGGKRKKTRTERPFDLDSYPARRIALKIAYFGWEYNGFASQLSYKEDSNDQSNPAVVTVEDVLFSTLRKTRLIGNIRDSGYSRCGRTDTGVSSVGQVVALKLRCSNQKLQKGESDASRALEEDRALKGNQALGDQALGDRALGNQALGNQALGNQALRNQALGDQALGDQALGDQALGDRALDIPICTMLNRNLPPEIRVLGWSYIPDGFDARFSCKGRRYKYFFAGLGLDINKMQMAAAKLVGSHDFRNFCRKDREKTVSNWTRQIFSSIIRERTDGMYEFEIHGSAFLYHQVRCTMEILFLIGRGLEPVGVIDYLLNVELCNEPPQYNLASEIPLVLTECYYDENLEWHVDETEQLRTEADLFELWRDLKAKSMTLDLLRSGDDPRTPFLGKPSNSHIIK
jgi:tRNA pseudouridine38/39 synthase